MHFRLLYITRPSLAFSCLVILLVLWFLGRPYILVNYAQLLRLVGSENSTLYEQALKASPNNLHLRIQTAEALVRTRRFDDATVTLLEHSKALADTSSEELLVELLISTGRYNLALQQIETSSPTFSLAPDTAAALWQGLRDQNVPLPLTARVSLLRWLLRLNPDAPAIKHLASALLNADNDDPKLARTIKWQQTCFTQIAKQHNQCIPKQNAVLISTNLAARLLQIPEQALQLGTDIVYSGNFVLPEPCIHCQPLSLSISNVPDWQPSIMADGKTWQAGAFVVGLAPQDRTNECCTLRVDGLKIEFLDANLEPARAGMVHDPITVTHELPYLVSFVYRTQDVTEPGASIWLSEKPEVFFAGDKFLPHTNGAWKRVTIIAWNRSGQDATIQPLLRSFSEGSVWFDDFSVRPILVDKPIEPREAIVSISNP